MRTRPVRLKVVLESLLLLGLVISESNSGFSRDKSETIQATAFGTGSQLGADIGVTLIIYKFSTSEDRQTLVQAYEEGQNQGLGTHCKK